MTFLKFLLIAALSLLWVAFVVFLCILSLAFETATVPIDRALVLTAGLALHTAVRI